MNATLIAPNIDTSVERISVTDHEGRLEFDVLYNGVSGKKSPSVTFRGGETI